MHLFYFQVPLTTELKFTECLDIFIQMCITKLKNDNEKDNVCTECANINFVILFLRVILSSLYFKLLFYRTSSKVLLYAVRDTCNDFLVQ